MAGSSTSGANFTNILTAIQNGVAAANNLAQILNQATINSSALQVTISSTIFVTINSTFFQPSSAATSGTVTTVNTSIGLTGGPITTTGTLAISLTKITASLGADVLLTNTSSYFDGPSVAQGSSGTWFASGTVTATDTAAGRMSAKLWDGTTVISAGGGDIGRANANVAISLSGFLTSPASNIRISVNDPTSSNGKILFNFTGTSKDSTITAIRIG